MYTYAIYTYTYTKRQQIKFIGQSNRPLWYIEVLKISQPYTYILETLETHEPTFSEDREGLECQDSWH